MKSAQRILLTSMAISSVWVFAQTPPPYRVPEAPDAVSWTPRRVTAWAEALTDYVYANHVVTGLHRKTYGMTYEFYRDGRKYQVYGLDTMHDGSWMATAMALMQRAVPDGRFLERALRYQVPFYGNLLLNSDRVFPNKPVRKGQDKKPLEEPVRGWVPRGWDEGIGFDLRTGEPLEKDSFYTPSNHLAQDLAMMLMSVWISTRNALLPEACGCLYRYRKEYFGDIPVVAFGYGFMTDDEALQRSYPTEVFDPTRNRFFQAFYELRKKSLEVPADSLDWAYQAACATASRTGSLSPELAWKVAQDVHNAAWALELFFGQRPWPLGLYPFDIQGHPAIENGRFGAHVDDTAYFFGARPAQGSGLGLAVMPALREHPEVWERRHRASYTNDRLVRIVDRPPSPEAFLGAVGAGTTVFSNEVTRVRMIADPMNLHIAVESKASAVNLLLMPADAVEGEANGAKWAFSPRGIHARNILGEPLELESAGARGRPWRAACRVPYGAVQGQKPWLTGVDHARYRLVAGSETQTIYLLSRPERIMRRLETLALGTLATWHEVWLKEGFIPSGWAPDDQPVGPWKVSDAGNTAHLIRCAAYWLIDRAGQSEWNLMRARAPASALPIPSLPATVLDAQGVRRP